MLVARFGEFLNRARLAIPPKSFMLQQESNLAYSPKMPNADVSRDTTIKYEHNHNKSMQLCSRYMVVLYDD